MLAVPVCSGLTRVLCIYCELIIVKESKMNANAKMDPSKLQLDQLILKGIRLSSKDLSEQEWLNVLQSSTFLVTNKMETFNSGKEYREWIERRNENFNQISNLNFDQSFYPKFDWLNINTRVAILYTKYFNGKFEEKYSSTGAKNDRLIQICLTNKGTLYLEEFTMNVHGEEKTPPHECLKLVHTSTYAKIPGLYSDIPVPHLLKVLYEKAPWSLTSIIFKLGEMVRDNKKTREQKLETTINVLSELERIEECLRGMG